MLKAENCLIDSRSPRIVRSRERFSSKKTSNNTIVEILIFNIIEKKDDKEMNILRYLEKSLRNIDSVPFKHLYFDL